MENEVNAVGTIVEPPAARYITEQDVIDAASVLQEYMRGKAHLDERVIEDERWWKGQHWAVMRQKQMKARKPFLPAPRPIRAKTSLHRGLPFFLKTLPTSAAARS